MDGLVLQSSSILQIDSIFNYSDIRLSNSGNFFKCHRCPVDTIGFNLLLDCAELKIFDVYCYMYGGYFDKLNMKMHTDIIRHHSDVFTLVIYISDGNYESMSEDAHSFFDSKSSLFICGYHVYLLDIYEFVSIYENIEITDVLVPNAQNPVIFSRIGHEDIYRLRFSQECSLEDLVYLINSMNKSIEWKRETVNSVKQLIDINNRLLGDVIIGGKHGLKDEE